LFIKLIVIFALSILANLKNYILKNYTLKQRLKAESIISLEINGCAYPQNYKDVIENLNKFNFIGELKISQAVQILEYTTNQSKDLMQIYNIFAATQQEVEQIQTDLKNLINIIIK